MGVLDKLLKDVNITKGIVTDTVSKYWSKIKIQKRYWLRIRYVI